MADRDRANILGIHVDNVTYEEALRKMEGFIMDGRPHQVVTVNPEFIVTARKDPYFARILNDSHLALPDGQGLLWASLILGSPLRQRVTGVDAVIRMAALSEKKGYRMYLLGAAQGVAEAAGQELRRRYPGLEIVGTYAGSPAPQEEDYIADLILRAHPHILFVAYGAPQQEKWISRNLLRLGIPVAMGVGGAFDFISGQAKRAPSWVQRLGLEWLHRLSHEPWRWHRALALPKFAWLVFRTRFR
ncbi:MAG: acetylglucosaminyldiphospho-UDP acetyl-beta-D-mannosaminyltransferase [Chloroflexi bacterium B3_Chlor]|nr:MAG: acetylglucosaminyldiphospho-UDP acetyl-beta-D-mannosaminyltransferase [Chloroflexi bacterium B3_Chlor]